MIDDNVISALDTAIATFTAHATGNTFSNNYIGCDPALATNDGIHLLGGAVGTSIIGNTIANGERAIILSGAGEGNNISQNVIFGNSEIGIDLGGDGVTPNDGADADEGENRLQNTPVIVNVAVLGEPHHAQLADHEPHQDHRCRHRHHRPADPGRSAIPGG